MVFCCAWVALETYGLLCQRRSIEQIKAWAKTIPVQGQVPLTGMEARLSGRPRRKVVDHEGTTRVIYTWPSLIGMYRLRGQVRPGGTLLFLDTEPRETEDFRTPFLVANEDGIRVLPVGRLPPPPAPAEIREDLLAATRTAFAEPKLAELHRPLVIFPVVDRQGVITPTGAAISTTAQFSMAYTFRKRMAIDPRIVRRILIEDRCWSPGTILDQPKIDVCLKAIGASDYAIPRAEQRDGRWHIQLEVRQMANDRREKFELQVEDLKYLPGLIALKLFEYLGTPAPPGERELIAGCQFQHPEEAEYFSRVANGTIKTEAALDLHSRLLIPNPRWIAVWDYFLDRENPFNSITFGNLPSPQDPEVQNVLNLARRVAVNDPGNVQDVFLELLKLTPRYRGESHFHRQLISCAQSLHDDILVAEMLEIWKAENNSYESRIARAQELLKWTRQVGIALPPDDLTVIEQRRRERYRQAELELHQAQKLLPDGWQAHAEMIRIAAFFRKPWSEVHGHFENALRCCPDNERAWQNMMNAAYSFSGPQNADVIYRFANQCLDSGLWRLSVPQQVPDLLRGVAYDKDSRTMITSQIQTAGHWQVMERFYRLAQQQPSGAASFRHAQASFAYDAAISGHYAEARPVFDELDDHFSPRSIQPGLQGYAAKEKTDTILSRFKGEDEYLRLRALVHANTGPAQSSK